MSEPRAYLVEGVGAPAEAPAYARHIDLYMDGTSSGDVAWADVTGKPATYPPEAHTHEWADVTGKPSTFTPEAHTHEIANVTGLQAILDDYEARLAALESAGA